MVSKFRVQWKRVERLLAKIAKRPALLSSYNEYWQKLKPDTDERYMDCWVFSAMSYLNTWQNNVSSYRYLKNLGYPLNRFGKAGLLEHVKAAKCGIYERRFESIWAADCRLWDGSKVLYPQPGEDLISFRGRLRDYIPGLGMAKLSFVIEMLYPTSSEVICLDRHGLRAYGLKDGASVSEKFYAELEAHWCGTCKELNIPAPLARHVMWDQMRNKWNTRYWSYILEDPSLAGAGFYDVHQPRYNGLITV